MSNKQLNETLEKVKCAVWCKTAEESQNYYTLWSQEYDDDLIILGSDGCQMATNMFLKHVKDKTSSKILDFGGGTGISSFLIRNQLQFQGEIDIMDANIDMLYKASQKKIAFRNIIRHFVGKSGDLPVRDASYDVIVTTGAFIPKHIPATAIQGVIKAIRSGGLLIMTRRLQGTGDYGEELDQNIDQLCSEKKLELLDHIEYGHFSNQENTIKSGCFVYMRK
uniref:Methyltransferase domain-containing protein n=1 Tax=Ciona savignyi TaxID=51511 RepID=H2ZNR6_CIOSA